jgi:hypothetical protein
VCFLDQEGAESYADAQIVIHDAVPGEPAEVSTIQFWHDGEQVTVIPTGYSDDGLRLFMTVEQLLEQGELPTLVIKSLARRLKKQPYRNSPNVAIHPLLKLLPDTQQ